MVRKPDRFRAHEQLVFFVRTGGRWQRGTVREVSAECRELNGGSHTDVHLGRNTVVVENHAAWCVYERHGTSWGLARSIRPRAGQMNQEIGLSGDRLVVRTDKAVDIYDRASDWQQTRVIDAPAGTTFTRLALSERWLVTRGTGVVYVYELATGHLVATLGSQADDDELATWLAVSDSVIVAIGSLDQIWKLDGTTWRPRGVLLGANTKSPPIFRPAAIGDVIWVGNPRHGDGSDGGTIHGFRLD